MPTVTPTPADHPQATPVVESCCGRRTILRAAALVALSGGAVASASCSADSAATSPSPAGGSAEPSPSSSSPSPLPSSSSSSPREKGSSEAVPEGTPVAIADVAVGGGVVVGEKYVITQPTDGKFKAFSAICTHQGCPVGAVQDGMIICPCHKSQFDIATGEPIQGPAQQPLPTVEFTQSGDQLYVTG